jgi:hypothetical protein
MHGATHIKRKRDYSIYISILEMFAIKYQLKIKRQQNISILTGNQLSAVMSEEYSCVGNVIG